MSAVQIETLSASKIATGSIRGWNEEGDAAAAASVSLYPLLKGHDEE